MHAEFSERCLESVTLAALDLEPAHDHLAELVVEKAVEERVEGRVGQQQPQAGGLRPAGQKPGPRGRVDNGHNRQGSPAHEKYALHAQQHQVNDRQTRSSQKQKT